MLLRVPDYYERFHCLAGGCPQSCCIGWEVEIDDDTAAWYAQAAGALGDKLRGSLCRDAEGTLCFPLSGGRCPFLDGAGLCEIHRQMGARHTSVTCREHPRFTEDFGPLREISLSASCPEAARLLLEGEEALSFPTVEIEEEGEAGDSWLAPLLALRERCMRLLADRSMPVRRRLAQLLALGSEAQLLLDDDRAEELPALCQRWTPLRVSHVTYDGAALLPSIFKKLASLEVLEPDWLALLRRAEGAQAASLPAPMLERMTAYFLFRWLAKAVNDGDALGRIQLTVLSVLTVERLSACTPSPREALYRYCREIEHCQENLDALLEAFWQEEALGVNSFFWELYND